MIFYGTGMYGRGCVMISSMAPNKAQKLDVAVCFLESLFLMLS